MGSIICYVSGIFLCMANLCLGCLQEYMLKAKFGLPSIEAEETVVEKRPPIRVKFEIPYFTVSGIQVKFWCLLLNFLGPKYSLQLHLSIGLSLLVTLDCCAYWFQNNPNPIVNWKFWSLIFDFWVGCWFQNLMGNVELANLHFFFLVYLLWPLTLILATIAGSLLKDHWEERISGFAMGAIYNYCWWIWATNLGVCSVLHEPSCFFFWNAGQCCL